MLFRIQMHTDYVTEPYFEQYSVYSCQLISQEKKSAREVFELILALLFKKCYVCVMLKYLPRESYC